MVYSAIANLEHALALAKTHRGFCAPNPAVGAIVLKNNRWLASGVHRGAGHPHAEVDALQKIDDAKGTTLVVTLEPCCHYGKTPPCTDLIFERGVSHVIYGFQDPNPKVNGGGALQLQSSGISTEYVALPAIADFYQSYAYWVNHRRPRVMAKLALTLDSKIAGEKSALVAITSNTLKTLTYQYRLQSDAILTSVQTVLMDNPQFNIRNRTPAIKKPVYVLDTHLRFPSSASLWKTASALTLFHGPHFDFVRHAALQQQGATLIEMPLNEHQKIDLSTVLDYLGEQGIHDVWVEAGGKLISSFLKENLLHEMMLYVAPTTLGERALSAFCLPQLFDHAKHITWKNIQSESICYIEF